MTPFLQLSLALALLVSAAKVGGYISFRLNQPSVLGEIITGLILGPSLIDILHIPYFTDEHLPEVIHELAEMGVLLLMFIAGMELRFSDMARNGRIAALSGTMGVIFPLAMGTGLGLVFSSDLNEAIYIGLILSATSVSISAQTLIEMNLLRSRVGFSLLGAAVLDDILVVLGVSVFNGFALSSTGANLGEILNVLLRMFLFLVIATAVGFFVLPKISSRIHRSPISQGLITFVIITALLYGWAAEELGGMAAITGAFLAGLMFSRSPIKEHFESGISSLAYSLFVPIFFIDVGLKANLRDLTGKIIWLFLAMALVSIVSKVLGAGLGGLLGGLSYREALQIGVGMMSRGEVGLIVALAGINAGVVPTSTFSVVVGVVILTTLLTPPLLRWSFYGSKKGQEAESIQPLSE